MSDETRSDETHDETHDEGEARGWSAPELVDPPRMCAGLPGVGGTIKASPEDFVVEEVPLYEPSGEGPHVYLWIQKRDASAKWLLKGLSRHFDVSERDLGTAGNKDRQAVTRQWVSIEGHRIGEPEDLGALVGPISEQIEVLAASRHRNKLKTGHLLGNRFEIVVRGMEAGVGEAEIRQRVEAIAERLLVEGVPNAYGVQRFGREAQTHEWGFGLLAQDRKIKGRLRRDRFMTRLALSAAQSALFNAVLAARMAEGTHRTPQLGDVMARAQGGLFTVTEADDLEALQARVDAGEIAVTGPMYGPQMLKAGGAPGELERQVLEGAGLGYDAFAAWGKLCAGTRRPLSVPLTQWGWSLAEDDGELTLTVRFFLPSGSYATILLQELIGASNHS